MYMYRHIHLVFLYSCPLFFCMRTCQILILGFLLKVSSFAENQIHDFVSGLSNCVTAVLTSSVSPASRAHCALRVGLLRFHVVFHKLQMRRDKYALVCLLSLQPVFLFGKSKSYYISFFMFFHADKFLIRSTC